MASLDNFSALVSAMQNGVISKETVVKNISAGTTNAQASTQAHTHNMPWTTSAKPPVTKIAHIGEFFNSSYSIKADQVQATLFGDDYSPMEFYTMNKNNTQLIRFLDDHTCMIGQEEVVFQDEAELGAAIIAKFAKMSLQGE